MRKPPAQLAPLSVAVAGLLLPGCARVTCDRFTLHGTLIGDTLAASVATDLPDHTEVEVRVSRLVHAEGEAIPYAIHYFVETGRIAGWHSPRTIELDHDKWWRDLRAKQQAGRPTGESLRVARIEPTIELEFLVPVDQTDKRFGDANWNLRGKAVDIEGNWRVVRRKLAFDCPLPGEDG
jgi:hypothetical protein